MKYKKRDNKSNNISDWSTKKLKEQALEYDDMIHGQNACYGSHDIQMLDNLLSELANRGYEFNNKLTIH